jgi:hypothetical protein
VDESGDLGGSLHSSRYFIISFVITSELDRIRKIPRKVRRKFSPRKVTPVELKHYKSSEIVIRSILEALDDIDHSIGWVGIDKRNLKKKMSYLNYEKIARIGFGIVRRSSIGQRYDIIIDRFSKKARHLDSYGKMVREELIGTSQNHVALLRNISFFDSMSEPALQINDFVTGTIFRWLERGENPNYDIIRKRIVFGILLDGNDLTPYDVANEHVHPPWRFR